MKILFYHHMGYYAFRRDFLMLYRTLFQIPLEKAESLEQLRVLEHGYKIKVASQSKNRWKSTTQKIWQ